MKKIINNKNFKISLALKVYSNFETVVQTKNKKDALKIAVAKYNDMECNE